MQVHLLLLRENPDKFGRTTGNCFPTIFCPISGLNTDIASLLLTAISRRLADYRTFPIVVPALSSYTAWPPSYQSSFCLILRQKDFLWHRKLLSDGFYLGIRYKPFFSSLQPTRRGKRWLQLLPVHFYYSFITLWSVDKNNRVSLLL